MTAEQLARRMVARQDAIARRMTAYAARFIAHHDGNPPAPTDAALAAAFARCSRPARSYEYAGIRRAFEAYVATHDHLAHLADRSVSEADAAVAAWQRVLDIATAQAPTTTGEDPTP